MTTSPVASSDATTDGPRDLPHLLHPAPAGATTLYLVRHGRTDSNVRGLLHGSTDVPLDAHGLRQAHRIAERLATEVEIDVLLASPLQRARTTAEIIGDRIGLRPRTLPELVEMDFGALEGVTVEQIIADHPEIAGRLADLEDDELAWPGGESRRQFHDRVLAVFLAILTEHHAHRVAVVAHGGVIGSFLARVHGVSPNDWTTYHTGNCSLTHLDIRPDRTTLHRFNDVVHLEILGAGDRPPEIAPPIPTGAGR